ncbi:MAG TPA: hypothetical protein VFP12_15160 [Allosphingosinicella sp.]|nr:hypothetical protein [Allosphingosinicella sp.]
MAKTKEDKLVLEIIERYGETIDLRRTPFLIVEIIRQYGPKLGGGIAAECLPPGGPPPKKFDPDDLLREISRKLKEIEQLSKTLHKSRF